MVFNNKNIIVLSIFLIFITIGCDGTLGGFNTIKFPISKYKLEKGIIILYSTHSKYKIPNELKKFDNWKKKGYDFLEAYSFYFDKNPKEIYYVSLIGDEETFRDSTHVEIAIRSVFVIDKKKWQREEEFTHEEKLRIQKRFKDEIISKLEKYTDSKSKDLNE